MILLLYSEKPLKPTINTLIFSDNWKTLQNSIGRERRDFEKDITVEELDKID